MAFTDVSQIHALRIVVKNTFIDGFEEDISNSTTDRRRRASAPPLTLPASLSRIICSVHPRKQESQTNFEECTDAGTDNTSMSDSSEFFGLTSSGDGTGSCSLSSGMTCDISFHNEDATQEKFPQESVESKDHYQGACRPCVWFWRPNSCSKGSSCEYCHLCDSGAVERAAAVKKKAKQSGRDAARYQQFRSRKWIGVTSSKPCKYP